MKPQRLNEQQTQIAEFLHHFICEEGHPPTNDEVAAAVGIRSVGNIPSKLSALERKGVIRREKVVGSDLKGAALAVVGVYLPDGRAANVDQIVYDKELDCWRFLEDDEDYDERVNRNCLRCGHAFVAPHRFKRLCHACNTECTREEMGIDGTRGSELYGASHRYMSNIQSMIERRKAGFRPFGSGK